MQAILEAKNISIRFNTAKGVVYAVNEVDLVLNKGEVLGIVGESGSGKTQLMHSLIRLLPGNAEVSGSIFYEGENIPDASQTRINTIRRNEIAMIFQDPMSCLNPYLKISQQLTEALLFDDKINKAEALQQAIDMLEKVQIPDAKQRIHSYPYQLSGGMRQRVMLAMALLRKPKVLIADEPTTALDVTVQAEILQLLKQLTAEYGLSVLFITHDLSIVAGQCDRVMVMYAGQVVEQASVNELFYQARHPYTQGLLASAKSQSGMSDKLISIAGQAPANNQRQPGCPFYARCEQRIDSCAKDTPVLSSNGSHSQACHLYG